MKFEIMHQCRGRIRVRACRPRMTLEQADLLEAYLQQGPGVERAVVHERTRCAILTYRGELPPLLEYLGRFSYGDPQVKRLAPLHSARALNRAYQERLVGRLAFQLARKVFLPEPLRAAYTVWRAVPFLLRGLRCLLGRRLRVELLDGLSIGASLARGDFSTAGSVMFLLGLGELLEEWTHKKSVDDLARCMALNVDRVWLKTEAGEVLTPLSQVRPGDLLALRMGGVVPVDGVIAQGEVMVNQASLTGEPLPVAKRPGTTVYAGTVVEEGACVLRVTQQTGESRYDKIVARIEETEKLKSAAESRASALADRLVPYTLAGSALVWLLTRNATRALSVLMVDFSCALKLSMPLAVLSAMGEAGRFHATVKGGKYLERLAQADTVVFDKTGTLTRACPRVARVVPFGGREEREMLRLAACLEEHFPHSIANAVVQAARERKLLHEEMHSQVEYLVAHGIASTVEGERVVIGSAHFVFEDEGTQIPAGEEEKFRDLPGQFTQLYLAIGGQLAAVICIADPLRAEAQEAVAALRRAGVTKTVMLTGDSQRTAAAIAAQVGVDEYRAEVLPEDKARFVEELQARGHQVVMLGDGINDSPALSAADVGIAVNEGAAIAREVADITVSAGDLRVLAQLRLLAQALQRRVRGNYRFVIAFNAALIALGAAGLLAPAASALLHNLSTLGTCLHSMTHLSFAERRGQRTPKGHS